LYRDYEAAPWSSEALDPNSFYKLEWNRAIFLPSFSVYQSCLLVGDCRGSKSSRLVPSLACAAGHLISQAAMPARPVFLGEVVRFQ